MRRKQPEVLFVVNLVICIAAGVMVAYLTGVILIGLLVSAAMLFVPDLIFRSR